MTPWGFAQGMLVARLFITFHHFQNAEQEFVMSEFEHRITVDMPADRVFDFLSEIKNMPRYLPTVRKAEPQGPDRVRMHGVAANHAYDNDGYYRVIKEQLRMEWGSDGENLYRGWLRVIPGHDQSKESSAEVVVHLSFEPNADLAKGLEKQTGDRDQTIDSGLANALQSIKNLCEGSGEKIEAAS